MRISSQIDFASKLGNDISSKAKKATTEAIISRSEKKDVVRATPCLEFTIPKFLFFSVLTFHLFFCFHVNTRHYTHTCMATLLFIGIVYFTIATGYWRWFLEALCLGIYGIMGNVPQTVSWHAKVFWEFLRMDMDMDMDDGPREAGNPGIRSDFGISWRIFFLSFLFFFYPGWVFSLLPRILVR